MEEGKVTFKENALLNYNRNRAAVWKFLLQSVRETGQYTLRCLKN